MSKASWTKRAMRKRFEGKLMAALVTAMAGAPSHMRGDVASRQLRAIVPVPLDAELAWAALQHKRRRG